MFSETTTKIIELLLFVIVVYILLFKGIHVSLKALLPKNNLTDDILAKMIVNDIFRQQYLKGAKIEVPTNLPVANKTTELAARIESFENAFLPLNRRINAGLF